MFEINVEYQYPTRTGVLAAEATARTMADVRDIVADDVVGEFIDPDGYGLRRSDFDVTLVMHDDRVDAFTFLVMASDRVYADVTVTF